MTEIVKKKRPYGKTIKLTLAKRKLFVSALKSGLSVTDACKKSLINRRRAYQDKHKYPQFAQAWDDARKSALLTLSDKVETTIYRRAFDTKDHASAKLLLAAAERLMPGEWGRRTTIRANVSVNSYQNMSDAELDAQIKRLSTSVQKDKSDGTD